MSAARGRYRLGYGVDDANIITCATLELIET